MTTKKRDPSLQALVLLSAGHVFRVAIYFTAASWPFLMA